MAKDYTPPYVIYYYDQDGRHLAHWESRTTGCFKAYGLGKPTNDKVEAWRKKMNSSFLIGGTNAHIRVKGNGLPHIYKVNVCRNVPQPLVRKPGEDHYVVATARAPMFEVV